MRDLLHLGTIGESRSGTKALFAKLDLSGDGKITAEELHESVLSMCEGGLARSVASSCFSCS